MYSISLINVGGRNEQTYLFLTSINMCSRQPLL